MAKYTKRQWVTLVVFGACQFCNSVCFSIQAPFYPAEAESKGATASEYGLVFGIYELVIFLICPIFGKYINKIGPKLVNNLGIFVVAIMCIAFGFLNHIDDATEFITASFIIRILEAVGCGAFITSAFSIIAKEFADNIGSAFAAMETCFAVGLIVGPTVGGALFEVGGYTLPFVVLGAILLLQSLMVFLLLPSQEKDNKDGENNNGQLFAALKIPSVAIFALVIVSTSMIIGFLQATLEPHLRPLDLTPVQLGFMFVLNGAAYAITAPLWGYLSDKAFTPRHVTICGSTVVFVAFLLVGPVPFIPLETTTTLCICSLILYGIGMGGNLVATFTGLHRDIIENGFPNDLSTYGLVSGIWNSSFAFGCFIGPSLGGVLFDSIGFGWCTFMISLLHMILVLTALFYLCCCTKRRNSSYIPIESSYCETANEKVSIVSRRDSTYGSGSSCENSV